MPPTPSLSPLDARTVLRFAASFVWADRKVADAERRFLAALARELAVDDQEIVERLLTAPPDPRDVDPARVSLPVAEAVRAAALRAIAADGVVERSEMLLFEMLDDLLPRPHAAPEAPSAATASASAPSAAEVAPGWSAG